MKKYGLLVLLFLALISKRYAVADEWGNKELKVLVLVISSENFPVFPYLQKIWKSYMHLDPEHIEAYFIKGDPDLPSDSEIREDIIWTKSDENYIPGILNKTVLAMEHMAPRLKEFDYVVRTNLSSFYYFPNLLKYLQNLPRENCYNAFIGYVDGAPYGGGAGIIFSRDLVELMIADKHQLMYDKSHYDDVVIGRYLLGKGIEVTPAPRVDIFSYYSWSMNKNKIPADAFHFRFKHENENLRVTEEVRVQLEAVKKYYRLYLYL